MGKLATSYYYCTEQACPPYAAAPCQMAYWNLADRQFADNLQDRDTEEKLY